MKRDIYKKLLDWKNNPKKRPLILKGARQVGKTYILKQFGAHEYAKTIYINFEDEPHLAQAFDRNLDPQRIMQELCATLQLDSFSPDNSLIIFDEIQECPNALNSLKYFNEKAPQYHVIAAGSLLGVQLSKYKSFPVGKVSFLQMHPLSFFEFLDSLGYHQLRVFLENITIIEPLNQAMHLQLIDLFKTYLFIGGMPSVINKYRENHSFEETRIEQKTILNSYQLDFSKHVSSNSQIMKRMDIWESIPTQIANENKKFTFSAIKKSARAREYEESIRWLTSAGMIYQIFQASSPKIPLLAYTNRQTFKIYTVDVGLLGAMANLPSSAIFHQDQILTEFKGSLTENFVLQEIICHHDIVPNYWTSNGKAEVDYIMQHDINIYPLEVKSGLSLKSKSLAVYDQKYSPTILSRTSLANLKLDGKILNYPLYLISFFPNKLLTSK